MGQKYIVTISHLLGSGGAELGKKLSEGLSVPFVDRQILKMAADKFGLPEESIADREERLMSFWESLARLSAFTDPLFSAADSVYSPTDEELFELESKFITEIALRGSAVFLGRGGRFLLRNLKPHFSVFVTADPQDRIRRIGRLYKIPEDSAKKLMERNDRERDRYLRVFAEPDWRDAGHYDIALNTSKIGIGQAADFILSVLKSDGA